MFINQYLISESNKSLKVPSKFKDFEISNKKIYYDENLILTSVEQNDVNILLLGFILDPKNPHRSNLSIINELSTYEESAQLIKALIYFSGRYVLLYKNQSIFIAITDYLSERNLYYSDIYNGIVTSNPKLALYMLDIKEEIPEHKLSLIHDREFLEKFEHWFIDYTDWDERFQKLLPNHYLNLTSLKAIRLPNIDIPLLSYEEVINKATEILSGTIEATILRYDNVLLPLTAGYDSRLLLSASYSFKNSIRYLTFNRRTTYVLRDVRIAKKLAKKFELNYRSIVPNKLKDSFINDFSKEFIIPRILPKTQNIQWLKENPSKNAIILYSAGAEINRERYDSTLVRNIDFPEKSLGLKESYISKEFLKNWLNESKISNHLNSKFLHEIELGKWSNLGNLEVDSTGYESFSPYNNAFYNLIIQKNVPYELKKEPHLFIRDIMERNLSGVTSLPFNPKTWKEHLKDFIPKSIFEGLKKFYRNLNQS